MSTAAEWPELADDARSIIEGLSVAEKVALLSGRGPWHMEAVPGLHDGRIEVADGPHGLRRHHPDRTPEGAKRTIPATCFPPAVTLASTWDTGLAEEVGRAIGAEARSVGLNVVLGPGLNIKRHPGGGRNFEYFSEDPLLSGHMAAGLVRGIQSHEVAACLKHYVANNQEFQRHTVDAVIDERTLREIYLRGFEVAVAESDPWTVMCAYNIVNGVYACEHRHLLTDVLRGEFGFDGLVMSDWGATNDRAAGIHAGLDMQMPGAAGAFDAEVRAAVATGTLAEADLDLGVARLAQLHERTTHPEHGPAPDLDAHHDLARRVAAAGTVLLTNDGILPLTEPGSIALLGAYASTPRYQGAGSSQVNPPRLATLNDELRTSLGDEASVTHRTVYDPATGVATGAAIRDAVEIAAAADVAIVVVGTPPSYESEGFDRQDLALPPDMVKLVKRVCDGQPRTVVVVVNGAPVDLAWAGNAAALVEAYLGGQAGGGALADVLLGHADPGGRLAESFPVSVADLPAHATWGDDPRQCLYTEGPWIGYRFHDAADIAPAFPFGHGLSYADITTSDASYSGGGEADGATLPGSVTATVANSSDRRGRHVVQVYVEPPAGVAQTPTRSLAGWAAVELDAGSTTTLEIKLDARSFQMFDAGAGRWVTLAGTHQIALARSVAEVTDRISVEVMSPDPAPTPPELGWANDSDAFAQIYGRPIPVPSDGRPFHRNSTLGEVATTPVGRPFANTIRKATRTQLARELPELSDELLTKFESVAFETPLRALVALADGKLSLSQIDTLTATLNKDWTAARSGAAREVKGLVRLVRQRLGR